MRKIAKISGWGVWCDGAEKGTPQTKQPREGIETKVKSSEEKLKKGTPVALAGAV